MNLALKEYYELINLVLKEYCESVNLFSENIVKVHYQRIHTVLKTLKGRNINSAISIIEWMKLKQCFNIH